MTARLLALLGTANVAFAAATSAVPERFPEDRYKALRAEAPFAVATALEKKEEVIPWAQNLYVSSVAKYRKNGVDLDWVILKDRTQPGTLINLIGTEPQGDYQLVKLEFADDPRKTKASVKKGTEFATVEVDQAAYTATAPQPTAPKPAMAAGQPIVRPPGQPQMPVPPGGVARPPGVQPPRPGIPPPVSIPRPTTLPPPLPQGGAVQQANPNSTNTRQRIRVIPSKP